MENTEQKKRRLFGKQYLPEYLNELNRLTNKNIGAEDLLSIMETDKIISKSSALRLVFSKKIPFSNKEELKAILVSENINFESSYFMFTSYSRDCGAVRIPSLTVFNFDFNFKDEHAGIISFVSLDFKEKILFDFYVENTFEYLDIEIYQV